MRAIGPPLTAEESAALIACARQCVRDRVRFRHTGRDPKTGLDCSGLLAWGLRAIGRHVDDRTDYGRDPHKDGLARAMEANLGPPVADAMRSGDVVLMDIEGAPRHVGLLADYPEPGELMLIHAYGPSRRVVEHILNDDWRGRVIAVYRP